LILLLFFVWLFFNDIVAVAFAAPFTGFCCTWLLLPKSWKLLHSFKRPTMLPKPVLATENRVKKMK